MNRKFVLVMAVLAIVVMAFYAYMGGFSAAAVTVSTSETHYVAGQAFKGTAKDPKMGAAFQRAAEVLGKKELTGVLGNIYYNNPDERGDSIDAFIGVLVQDTAATLPAGYELRTVPGGKKVLRGEVKAHYLLAPNKLYEAIFDHAQKQNLKLETLYVEWFPEDHKGIVEVPVLE